MTATAAGTITRKRSADAPRAPTNCRNTDKVCHIRFYAGPEFGFNFESGRRTGMNIEVPATYEFRDGDFIFR